MHARFYLLGALTGAVSALVSSGYFAGYHANVRGSGFNVSQIPWNRYKGGNVMWAFAETTEYHGLNLSKSSPQLIPEFVAQAKANKVKAFASIGGWAGSRYFSTSFGDETSRTAFLKSVTDLVDEYHFDGIDFDYEYPGKQGYGCNAVSPQDTANFLIFLQALKAARPGLSLTAAGPLYPWVDASGAQTTNNGLEGFADVLDYVTVMGYDVYTALSHTAGPNAPIEQACDARNTQGGIKEGLAKWEAAGLPASKLVLGLAFYGHMFDVLISQALDLNTGAIQFYPEQNQPAVRLRGGPWDNDPEIDLCGNPASPSGTITFSQMSTGRHWLNSTGDPASYTGESRRPERVPDYGYNECSGTEALYDRPGQTWVSYDGVRSMKRKGELIQQLGLAGFSAFEIGGDLNTLLVDAVKEGAGGSCS